jgi:hypothetical protein
MHFPLLLSSSLDITVVNNTAMNFGVQVSQSFSKSFSYIQILSECLCPPKFVLKPAPNCGHIKRLGLQEIRSWGLCP